jgi:hypothetical protein
VGRTSMSVDEAVSRVEIIDLFAKYCHAVDQCEFGVFDEIFTDDVVADYSEVRGPDDEPILHSRDAFAAWLRQSMAGIGPGMTHFMTNHLITVDGDQARIVSHNHVLNVGMGGVYHSHAIRTDDGWRIDQIRFEARYFATVADKLTASIATMSAAAQA